MKSLRIVLFTLLLFAIPSLYAQSSFGGHPGKIVWNQINTDIVSVIYPDSLVEKAQRVVNIIHYMHEQNVGLYGKKRKKIDIIIQNQQVISNGFAQVAPFKSEFFLQAPQRTFEESNTDWMDLLALHEYRHLNQFVNHKRGIGNILYLLFGDYGRGAMIGISAPAWFLEGDAVINETALSDGGRGRIPSFSMKQRALLSNDVNYRYMKALNGSYKDFVPSHYHSGYLICSEIRRTHGNESWNTITKRAAKLNGIIYPFPKAVKKETGKKIREHYYTASEKLKASIPENTFESKVLNQEKKKDVVVYDFPVFDEGNIYFNHSSRRKITGIYKFDQSGKEELVVHAGLILDRYFSKKGNKIIWAELQRDIRRGNQNYSNLILYNTSTKIKEIIGRGDRLFSPSFSLDGNKIVYVRSTVGGSSSVATRDLQTLQEKTLVGSKTTQFLYPIFSANGNHIYCIVKKGHSLALASIDLEGAMNLLTEWDKVVFGPIKLSEGHLIFHANYEDRDNIYALEIASKQIKIISDDNIGLYNPSHYSDGKIIASKMHARGILLHEFETNISDWKPISKPRSSSAPYYLETAHLEGRNIFDEVPDQVFETNKYPRNQKLFNPHSWYAGTDGNEFSATLVSDNVLNNLSISPEISYNSNVKGAFASIGIDYGRWFPVYGLDYTYGFPRTVTSSDGENSFTVSQHSLRPAINIPLNLTKGIYSTRLNFNNSVTFQQSYIQEQETLQEFNQASLALNNIINFQSLRFRAQQNMYPRWGVTSTLYNRHRFNDDHNVFNINNDIFIPGFHVNHGFKFEIDYTRRNSTDEDRFPLVDIFNYAEGFTSLDHDNILSFNSNYALPLFYPDWGFADLMYFKRIKSVLFHNYNKLNFEGNRYDLQSAGADLLFDVSFANNVFSELTLGVRNAYYFGNTSDGPVSGYHFEFILDIPAF